MRNTLMSNLAFWRDKNTEDAPAMMDRAREMVSWSQRPYHDDFLKWLRAMADRPIEPGKSSHADLIVANARANTFKEIRQYIVDETEKAHRVMEHEYGR